MTDKNIILKNGLGKHVVALLIKCWNIIGMNNILHISNYNCLDEKVVFDEWYNCFETSTDG